MKKRVAILVAAVALLSCSVCVVVLVWPNGPGVSESNFRRVHAGMTRGQVEELFSGPATQERPGPNGGQMTRFWLTQDDFVGAIVIFDRQDLVVDTHWRDHTFLGRIRAFLP